MFYWTQGVKYECPINGHCSSEFDLLEDVADHVITARSQAGTRRSLRSQTPPGAVDGSSPFPAPDPDNHDASEDPEGSGHGAAERQASESVEPVPADTFVHSSTDRIPDTDKSLLLKLKEQGYDAREISERLIHVSSIFSARKIYGAVYRWDRNM